ncbi:hypothetical protein [Pleurocapsa sp. FMAR1]|uniref:hypothetical protein n=1 Tax=Pleurocapsa sp. FMAR1 TaxID=3040204 RepID=UPI0029C79BD3|nr:hypothetical protein [Pleurocapsa sp. FMAR1]
MTFILSAWVSVRLDRECQDSSETWSRKLNDAGEIYKLIENDKTPGFDLYVGSRRACGYLADLKGNDYSLISRSDTALLVLGYYLQRKLELLSY